MAEETIILRVEIDQEQAIKDTVELSSQIDRLTQKQKELDKSTEAGAIAYAENAASLRALKAEQSQMNKVIDNSIITRNKEIKSINEARANVKLLTEQRNKLDISTDAGKKKLIELNAALDKNNAFIKNNVDAYTKQKIGIGDYEGALTRVLGSNNKFVQGLQSLKDGLEQTKKGIDVSKAGFSGFNGVIKASAIGVLITLVGGLIAAFTKFEPLMDKLKAAFAGINAVVDVFVERMTRVGRGLAEIMQGNFSEGIDQIRNSFDGMAAQMEASAKAAYDLSEALDAIDDRKRAQLILDAQTEQQTAKLMLQAKDRTKSDKDRIGFLKQAEEIEKKNFETAKKLRQDEYENYLMTLKNRTQLSKAELEELLTNTDRREELEKRIGTVTGEELDKLAGMKVETMKLETDTVVFLEGLNNRRNKLYEDIKKEREEDLKKIEKEEEEKKKLAEKTLKARMDLAKYEQQIREQADDYRAQKLKEESDEIQFTENERQTALVNSLTQRNITQQQYDEQLLQIKLTSLEKERELLVKQGEDTTAIDLQISQQKLSIKENETKTIEKLNEEQMKSAVAVANSAQDVINSLASTMQAGKEQQKGIALANVGINLGTAISNLVATTSAPSPDNVVTGGISGFVKYAAFLTQVLSSIGQARSIIGGAAAGGGTFRTKGPTMLLVGDNPGGVEEIKVKPISGKGKTVVNPKGNLIAMAGGGTLIADGGMSTSRITQQATQQFNMVEMMKNLPQPVLKITDLNRVQKNKNRAVSVSSLG